MTFEGDLYAILGVPPDADDREIRQAYHQMARRYHPDRSPEEGAAAQFIAIREAYRVLSDPVQRRAFDKWHQQEGLGRPLPLQLRVTTSQSTLPCLNESQALYALVELSACKEIESERLPLNLSLVLDRSTSMKGARLHRVKEAARYMVEQAEPQDVLSVVVFSDKGEVILPAQPAFDKAAARAAISGIRGSGGTELLQGLRLGLHEVSRWQSEHRHNHLVLLTDGHTFGDEEGCLQEAKLAGERNIVLTLMGVGDDWNDRLLDQMAELSQGISLYIDSSTKIAQVFRGRLGRLGNVFAQSLVLSLHLSQGVRLKEAFRISPQISQLHLSDNTVGLPVLEKDEPQVMLLELLVERQQPGEHRLFQVEVTGTVPALGNEEVQVRRAVTLSFEADLHRKTPVPADIVSAMAKLTIFKMQERAMAEAEAGQIEPAVNHLRTLATRLLDMGETQLARAALLEAGQLAKTGSLSARGSKQIRYGTRKLTILPKEVRHD